MRSVVTVVPDDGEVPRPATSTGFQRRSLTLASVAALFAAPGARAAEPLKIGMLGSLTGPEATGAQTDPVRGARLAAEEVNKAGGVLGGRPVELVVEDTRATQAGAVAAFARLAARPDLVAFVGPDRSAWVHALSGHVVRAGLPMMVGGTDPALTRLGNPWLFRCRPNDAYSARAIAEYGVRTLAARRWAIVHADDAFGIAGRDTLTQELGRLGVEPVLARGLPPDIRDAQDATPVVQAARDARADVIASYLLPHQFVPLAVQLRQGGGGAAWIGSPGITAAVVRERVGPALEGAYGVTDFAPEAGPAAAAFARRYEAAYGRSADPFSAWAFDAVTLLAKAVADAGGATEPERLRAALLAIRGHEGAQGTYRFDANGDGLRGYNVVRHAGGRWVFERRIESQD
jgi:branched-chain amino acid transport system substrate-binding protein